MPQVTRPTKTAGNTTYVEEVADGATTILASEVDADFAALIVGINTVDTAQIANSAVTTAKIADSNVTTAKIADANVTAAKLADGATFIQYGRTTQGTPLALTGAITNFVSQAITVTRTRTRIHGTVNFSIAAANATVSVIIRRDASTIASYPNFLFSTDTAVYISIIDPVVSVGAHTYHLAVQQVAGAGAPSAVAGSISVEEIA